MKKIKNKKMSSYREFGTAMQLLLAHVQGERMSKENRLNQQPTASDTAGAEQQIEACTDLLMEALVTNLHPKIDSYQAASFYALAIAKVVGFQRAFTENRNPAKERRENKKIIEAFIQGIEMMIPIYETRTKEAVRKGLIAKDYGKKIADDIENNDIEKYFKDSEDKEETESGEKKDRKVIIPT